MALIKCSECGKEISDSVKYCIKCGAPIKDKKNIKIQSDEYKDTYQDIITKIIAIFILAFLVFVGSIIIVKL